MIKNLALEGLPSDAANRIRPFFEEILKGSPKPVHSLCVTGSAVSSDFDEKTSDVNSLIILDDMHFEFIKFLAPFGKKFKAKGIAAPLVMTPSYINESLDVFPMEFLDLKLIHRTVYGPDVLKDIEIDRGLLRLQCEREIKTRLIGLWHGYVSSLGESDMIISLLLRSIKGCMPLFRAIIFLTGKEEPPRKKNDVITVLGEAARIRVDVFSKVLSLKEKRTKDREEILSLFENYYGNLDTVSDIINAIPQ